MLVMVVPVGVAMALTVMVIVVVVVAMTMAVTMTVAMAVVGAAHGLEGFADIADLGAKPQQHIPYYVVTANEDALSLDLGRQVAVADVPGQFGQGEWGIHPDFHQVLFGRDDFGLPAILQQQPVAMRQHHGFREIHEKLVAVLQGQDLAAQMTFVVFEHDDVERRCRVVMGDGGDAKHVQCPQNRK